MEPRKPSIRSVAEVVINVSDLQRAQDFYETVLRFEFHSAYPSDKPTIVFLTIAETDSPLGRHGHPQLLALVDPRRHPPAMQRFRGLDVSVSSLNHIAFEILPEDYNAEKQWLESHDLSVTEETFPHMNARALFFRDPDGNTLELICHDRSGE